MKKNFQNHFQNPSEKIDFCSFFSEGETFNKKAFSDFVDASFNLNKEVNHIGNIIIPICFRVFRKLNEKYQIISNEEFYADQNAKFNILYVKINEEVSKMLSFKNVNEWWPHMSFLDFECDLIEKISSNILEFIHLDTNKKYCIEDLIFFAENNDEIEFCFWEIKK